MFNFKVADIKHEQIILFLTNFESKLQGSMGIKQTPHKQYVPEGTVAAAKAPCALKMAHHAYNTCSTYSSIPTPSHCKI